jgi:cytochrome P450
MFGIIIAAHDTTATTIAWTLKLLADYQDVQNKLRSSLHAAFSTAKGEARPPTHREIVKTAMPYLDVVIEEALRYARTVTTTIRTTTQDVEVLGHVIPKKKLRGLLAQPRPQHLQPRLLHPELLTQRERACSQGPYRLLGPSRHGTVQS